ncbi:C39 family peptidase [Sulfobacillus thermosulfidooxidans]|uniref:C39 family peptidase n=1 Tax=Sulfobacillus thermosulfidooxidans TaxID=28034 RepID=UPI0002F2533A|nr:C39 family peptidase [Sulfobacillus thermosulfidooxidans]
MSYEKPSDPLKSRNKKKNSRVGAIISIIVAVIAVGIVASVFSQQLHGLVASSPSHKAIAKKKKPKQPPPLPKHILLPVTPQSQSPQLPNGAKVTTLSMMLSAVHHPVSKMVLAKKIHVDPTKEVIKHYTTSSGKKVYQITKWGDPNMGYVGSMYKSGKGYGVYHGPLLTLLNKVWPKHGVDLTNHSFSSILAAVGRRHPVEIWTTLNFQPTNFWISWTSPEGKFVGTPEENAALIVGYNKSKGLVYVDNPGNGTLQKVSLTPLEKSWKQLGSQAVTVTATVPVPKSPAKSKHTKSTKTAKSHSG